jgi:hypothetical protein
MRMWKCGPDYAHFRRHFVWQLRKHDQPQIVLKK